MSKDTWGDFKFAETQHNSFLNLRNSIKEHICRFLVDKKDIYQTSLVHSKWTMAAQNVLWENATFEMPANLRLFLESIQNNNKTALLVKNIKLPFTDHDDDSLFKQIVKSKLPRHSKKTEVQNPLINLEIITRMTNFCENVTDITIYGWLLQLQDIELLSIFAKNLKSLHIIGAPDKVPINLNPLLPRLNTLRLDGLFGLNPTWASSCVKKAVNLSCLQFSLQDIMPDTLIAMCSPTLKLTELVLTDATELTDEYVQKVLAAFPGLKRFCVEGSRHLTSVSIAHSLMLCPQLADLEIRANTPLNVVHNNLDRLLFVLLNGDHSFLAKPTRLVIQNLSITDEELHRLSQYFVHLKYLGLSGCPNLSNVCFEELVENEHFRFLQRIHIQQCPLIDSGLFGLLTLSQEIRQSLMRVKMDSNGPVDIQDIYQLCHQCSSYNLRKISLVSYKNLFATVIGSFNESTNNNLLLLTRRSIDALAHSTDPTLTKSVPEDIFLTGKQVVSLAANLSMPVSDLQEMIDLIKEDEQALANDTNGLNISQISHDRLSTLRAPSRSDARPSTPAVWSNDLAMNGSLTIASSAPPKIIETPTSQPFEEHGYQNDDDEVEDDDEDVAYGVNSFDEDEEDEDDDEEEVLSSGKSQTSWEHNADAFIPEGNLGGWGAPVQDNWGTPSTSTSLSTKNSNTISNTISLKEVQEQQQQQQHHHQQQQSTQAWTPYQANTYKDQWQQSPLQHNTNNRKSLISGHYRNTPMVTESEGWGQPDKVVPWEDVNQQGYSKETLEEQASTIYWGQNNGQWFDLKSTTNNNTSNNLNTTEWKSTKPAATKGRKPSISNRYHRDPKLDSSSSDDDHYNTSASEHHVTFASFQSIVQGTRPRSTSVVSSDHGINWNEDSNVIIKARKDFPRHQKPNADKSREPVASKWNTAAEWQENKAAKSSWPAPAPAPAPAVPHVNTSVQKFSRPPRGSNTPRHKNSNDNNNWTDFAANFSSLPATPNKVNSTPPLKVARPPVITSSIAAVPFVPSPVPKPSPPSVSPAAAPLLVDTDNSSKVKKPKQGDIWENISSLGMEYPLVATTAKPKEILCPTNTVQSGPLVDEILDWDASNNDDINSDAPRFTATIPGTVTDAEIMQQEQAIEQDNLVFFDSDSNSDDEQHKQQEQEQQAIKSSNAMDDIASLSFNTAAPVVSPVPQRTSEVSRLVSNHHHQQQPASESDDSPPESLALVPHQSPSGSGSGSVSVSVSPESSTAVVLGSTATSPALTRPRKIRPLKLTFPNRGHIIIRYDDNIEEVVDAYCREWNVEAYRQNILDSCTSQWTHKLTEHILAKGSKKTKKTTPLLKN